MLVKFLSNQGINTRVLVLAITPVILVSTVLSFYLTSSRIADAEKALHDKGNLLVQHLTQTSQFGVLTGNTKLLQAITRQSLKEIDVAAVAILDSNKKQIALSSNPDLITLSEGSDLTHYRDTPLFKLFEMPIVSADINLFDYSDFQLFSNDINNLVVDEAEGWVQLLVSKNSTKGRQNQMIFNSVLITAAGVFISILLGVRIGNSITRPIRKLSTMEKRLRAGDYKNRIEVINGGEIGALEESFNATAFAFEQTDRHLKRQVEAATNRLLETVTELENKNLELDLARQDAEQANNAKAEFLAKMSHEIRTPMNAVIGFTSLLTNSQLSYDQHEYIRIIRQAAFQLLTVIDDILNFSKLESGNIELEAIEFNTRENLEDVVCMLGPSAHDKNLELVLLVHSDVPEYLIGDPTRINQIVTNLVNNAIKFTRSGYVVVQVFIKNLYDHAATIEVSVRDSGVGG